MVRRILAIALVIVVLLLATAATFAYVASARRLNARHPVPVRALRVPADAASVERRRCLFRAIGNCTLCHGEDGGGGVYAESALLGVIAGPNLTRGRGGVGGRFRDSDWDRAIRFGLRADGRIQSCTRCGCTSDRFRRDPSARSSPRDAAYSRPCATYRSTSSRE